MSFKDHFSGHADDYARFRPDYPTDLFHYLKQLAPGAQTVWDCGSGNGQASRQLANFFPQVFATDASAQQIASASGPANVRFRCASAEDSGLADNSVDLICVAQALHWFDVPSFYREARRVARPGAVLAVWAYGFATVEGISPAILEQYQDDILGPYWPPERAWIDQGYANIDLPGRPCAPQILNMQLIWPIEAFLGYIGSWSATRRYFAATGHDPLPELGQRLAREWGDSTTERLVRWPLFVKSTYLSVDPIS